MAEAKEVRTVQTWRDRKAFVTLPWKIYRDDPNWIPPLLIDMYNTLDPKKNALLRLGPNRFFVVYKEGHPVGRIGVGIDRRLNEAKGVNLGYLTLFESIEDFDVARTLFDAGLNWLRLEGVETVTGPQSPSNGDDYRGLLIKGHDSAPVLLNSYNPQYYAGFFDQYGFIKDFDRNAYFFDISKGPPERLNRGVAMAQKRYGFKVRPINLKQLDKEVLVMKKILDQSMPDWPDMIPPSMDELEAEVDKLKQLAVADFIIFIEGSEGEPAGFSVALPDYNQVLARMNGRLFPLGLLKFLWYRRKISGIRVFALFVTPYWRKRGVSAALYYHTMLNAYRMGYTYGEGSTIHEFNTKMNLELTKVGGDLYKIYRIYRLDL